MAKQILKEGQNKSEQYIRISSLKNHYLLGIDEKQTENKIINYNAV